MFDEKAMGLMRQLMEARRPPGFEREVASLLKSYLKPYAYEIVADKLGSITFVVKGSEERPRVLLAGHIDEVGFIVSSITDEGFLTFHPLGDGGARFCWVRGSSSGRLRGILSAS